MIFIFKNFSPNAVSKKHFMKSDWTLTFGGLVPDHHLLFFCTVGNPQVLLTGLISYLKAVVEETELHI